jgi:GNAT superfamily N-acetyltransferase
MTVVRSPGSYRIRPIARSDRDGLIRFYADLSPDSREARFHGAAPGIGDGTARFFCGPDHEHREGLVAESTDADGRGIIVGHVCLEPIDVGQAEMAIAIADSWQHLGLGRAMLSRAIAWARGHDVARLSASIRWSNGAMIGLIRSMGLPVTVDDRGGGVVDAIIDVRAPVPHAA